MRRTEEDLARLRDFLLQGSFAEQDRLPPERELAGKLGLTRNRLRTGLRRLAAEGVIWRHVGRGTFMGARLAPPGVPFPIAPLPDLTSPREVMEARLAIEPELARLAAFRATGRDLSEIGNCLDRMVAVEDWNSWEALDCRLHRAIAQAAGNTLMLLMFDTVQANRNKDVWGRLREPIEPAAATRLATAEHAAIVDALRHRQADAAMAAMRHHLRRVTRSIFGED